MLKYQGVELDLTVTDHGSIMLVKPDTDEARAQLHALTDAGETQWFANALVVEPRYVEDLIAACARGEGL